MMPALLHLCVSVLVSVPYFPHFSLDVNCTALVQFSVSVRLHAIFSLFFLMSNVRRHSSVWLLYMKIHMSERLFLRAIQAKDAL